MVMRHVIAPVVPKFFHRHTLGRVFRNVAEPQSVPVALEEFSDPFRCFGLMDPRTIGHEDHPPSAFGRTLQTFFGQAAKRFGIALLGADPHDLARAPIGGAILLPLRGTLARRMHFALLSAQHPAAFQCREQTQFRLIFYVDIRASRRVVQKPCNSGFF